jgi:hypothetical protein
VTDDKMKFIKLYTLLAEWQIMAEKFETLSETNPSDFVVIQHALYAAHASQLEQILNG